MFKVNAQYSLARHLTAVKSGNIGNCINNERPVQRRVFSNIIAIIDFLGDLFPRIQSKRKVASSSLLARFGSQRVRDATNKQLQTTVISHWAIQKWHVLVVDTGTFSRKNRICASPINHRAAHFDLQTPKRNVSHPTHIQATHRSFGDLRSMQATTEKTP